MKAISYKLEDLLKEAKAGKFVLPVFQRDYVWKKQDIVQLIESLVRGYPTGALLTASQDALKIPGKPFKILNPPPISETGGDLLLDGQQRLTSLLKGFKNEDETHLFYFNLDTMYAELVKEEGEDELWVTSRRKYTKKRNGSLEAKTTKQKCPTASELPCEDALHSERAMVRVRNYVESLDPPLSKEEAMRAEAKLCSALETVRNAQIWFHHLDKNENAQAICKIFEVINKTGEALTTSDLVLAKHFSDDTEKDLRSQIEIIKKANPHIEPEHLLHTIYLYYQAISNKKQGLTAQSLLNMPGNVWLENLAAATTALNAVNQWALANFGSDKKTSHGKDHLVPKALAEVLAAVEMQYPNRLVNSTVSTRLRRWLFAKLWKTDNYTKSNSAKDLQTLHSFFKIEGKNPEVLVEDSRPKALTPEDVLKFKSPGRRYGLLMSLIKGEAVYDLHGEKFESHIPLHDHHIIPQNNRFSLALNKDLQNSIANRVMVTARTNLRISDNLPSKYLKDVENERGEKEANRFMENNLIPLCFKDPSRYTNATSLEKLIHARACLIANRFNDYLALQVDPSLEASAEEDEEDEEA